MTLTDKETEHQVGRRTLETVGLTKTFGGVTAVDGATVTFQHGKINALIGPNGSGKTTFFNCVTGMIKPDAGRVSYAGKDITNKAPHRIARAGIGRSFQLCRIFPRMTVLENMLVGVRPAGMLQRLASARNAGDIERARELLRRVGIDHLERSEARDISYGQQKLLELAGVLMVEPETIMLDEPAGGVNPALIGRIGTLVRELNDEGRTFIIVEHNMEMVMSLSDHVVVFDRGRPIAEGSPAHGAGRPPSPGGLPWRLTLFPDPLPPDPSTSSSSTTSRPATGAPHWCSAGSRVKVPPSTIVCLVGPNGAGKSTVLKVASGMLTPRSGVIRVDGTDVTRSGPQDMLRSGLSHVLQGHSVFKEMTVAENVALGAYTVRDKALIAERTEFVKTLFPVVAERWRALAGALSGGEQKQVEFARSLMVSPKVVLLDEPSMGLDPKTTSKVFEQVVRMRDAGIAVLLVEQNARRALETADIGCVLDLGRVHITGPAPELLADPQLAELYLGGRPTAAPTATPTPTPTATGTAKSTPPTT